MKHAFAGLGPAASMALALLAVTTLGVAAPHAPWALAAGPALLIGAALLADRVQHGRGWPSADVALLAVVTAGVSAVVAARAPGLLTVTTPILGVFAAAPIALRTGAPCGFGEARDAS